MNESMTNSRMAYRRVLGPMLLTMLALPCAMLVVASPMLTTRAFAQTTADAGVPSAPPPEDPADDSAVDDAADDHVEAPTTEAQADPVVTTTDETPDAEIPAGGTTDDGTVVTPADGTTEADDDDGDGDVDVDSDDAATDASTDEEVAEVQAAHEPLAWRNTFFSYTLGSTFNTLCRGCQLSYNPTVYSTFFLTPRWYVDAQTFFVVNQGLFIEHTGDDFGTYNSEAQLYDTTIEIRHVESVEGFSFLPAFRLMLPVSKLSQAAQRYFNLAVGLTIVRPFPEAAGLTFALTMRYQRWFAGSNVPLTRSPFPATTGSGAPLSPPVMACQDAASCSNQASGSTSEVDRIVAGLTVSVSPFENFTLTLQTFFIWGNGYGLREESIATATGNTLVGDGSSHWRPFSSYSLQAAYDIVPWFNLALGITNATNLSPFFSENGDVRSPFNPDTQFYLSATITLDSLYESFASSGEDDGLTPEQRQRRRQGLAQRTSTTAGSL